mmetsp:Transcript_94813/g.198077  ORF Transcript_94813/g.198077 Transcript_94813/m.198077 type:complete len:287 (-) Transcript_94813:2648-3508(-)
MVATHHIQENAGLGVPVSDSAISRASHESEVSGDVRHSFGRAERSAEEEVVDEVQALVRVLDAWEFGQDGVQELVLGDVLLTLQQGANTGEGFVLAGHDKLHGHGNHLERSTAHPGEVVDVVVLPVPLEGVPVAAAQKDGAPFRDLCRRKEGTCNALGAGDSLASTPFPDVGDATEERPHTSGDDSQAVEQHRGSLDGSIRELGHESLARLARADFPDPAGGIITAGDSVDGVLQHLHGVDSDRLLAVATVQAEEGLEVVGARAHRNTGAALGSVAMLAVEEAQHP